MTANLNVNYLKPTPIGIELVQRTQIKSLHERKAVVACSFYAGDVECAYGEVVAVRVPSRAGVL